MLDAISDNTLIIGVFTILTFLNITGIFNNTYYSNDKKSQKAMSHYLNIKYKLYKNKNIDVSRINKIYGILNIFLSVSAPFFMIYFSSVAGVVYYVTGMIVGNLLANNYIVNRYCKK